MNTTTVVVGAAGFGAGCTFFGMFAIVALLVQQGVMDRICRLERMLRPMPNKETTLAVGRVTSHELIALDTPRGSRVFIAGEFFADPGSTVRLVQA